MGGCAKFERHKDACAKGGGVDSIAHALEDLVEDVIPRSAWLANDA